jgi:hypothetical protein
MIESITKAKLDKLIANHNKNRKLEIVTDAVFVTRKHFDQFLSRLPQNHDAFKICFIRHDTPPLDPRILPAGNNVTQLSLIFVPMKNTDRVTWKSTEAADDDGTIRTLCFCEPGRRDDDNTGHCPPASGCPPGDT